MQHLLKRRSPAYRNVLVALSAVGAVSCVDILGLAPGHIREDDDASVPFDGSAPDVRSTGNGGSADGSTDGPRQDTPRGDSGGSGGSGGSGNSGGSAGNTIDGGPGGAGATGGTGSGGAGATGGTGSGGAAAGGASGAGGTGTTGGAAGAGATGGTGAGGSGPIDAGPDRGTTCTTGQKLCNSVCVPTTDPATGCAAAACTPCSFPNAAAVCTSGQCALGTCTTGFADCKKTDPTDGCETDLSKPETCGSCTVMCGTSAPLCSGSNGSYSCVTGCTAPTSTLCGSQCVDVNTNATHCGDCPTACTVPTNGKVSCASAKCVTTCNTNFHACTAGTVTTCADDNSPATCGTACSPCTTSDPNADPATATCVNKTCGFSCKSGFNLCSGVCSDTNSTSTCGPSCKQCTKPANASAVSCDGTNCVVTCNPGYDVSGTSCVALTSLYVSTTGSDTNTGSQASPFRSWKKAAQYAKSGMTVNFAAGTYNASGGDDFADAIPNGVTLQSSGGTVTLSADGTHSLVFTGSGNITGLTLTNFDSPLTATTGTQNIKSVIITNPKSAVSVSGGAIMSFSGNSSLTGSPDQASLFTVDGSAQLNLTDTTGAVGAATGGCAMAGGLHALGSATVTLVNYTCGGNVWPCVQAEGSAVLNISGSTLVSSCNGGVALSGNASLSSTSTSYSSISVNDTATVNVGGGAVTAGSWCMLSSTGRSTFHGCRFDQTVMVYATGADFGSGGASNTFNAGLSVQASPVIINAAGNHWIPNQQGADSSGTMPTTPIVGPVDGPNVTVTANSTVTM